LSFYPTPAFATEVLHIFVATNLKYVGAKPDDDEFLEVKVLPLNQAIRWVKEKKICDAKSIIALLSVSSFFRKKIKS
jgi:ADP-ribose pyrophosphatase